MQEIALYTTAEVATLFRVDTSTVRRWATDKAVPAIKTPGARGEYRFPKDEIDKLLLQAARNPEGATA